MVYHVTMDRDTPNETQDGYYSIDATETKTRRNNTIVAIQHNWCNSSKSWDPKQLVQNNTAPATISLFSDIGAYPHPETSVFV